MRATARSRHPSLRAPPRPRAVMEPPEIQPASINISVQQTEANRFSVDNLVAFACGGHQAVVIQDGPAPARTVMIPAFCNIPASLLNLVRLPALKELKAPYHFNLWLVAGAPGLASETWAPGDIAVTQRVCAGLRWVRPLHSDCGVELCVIVQIIFDDR